MVQLTSFCCRFDRRKRYKTKDWHVTHSSYIHLWQTRVPHAVIAGPPHDQYTFDEYLRWLHRSTRTHIKSPYTEEAINEEDVIEDVYDVATRDDTQLQRAPLQRYVIRYSNGTICYPFGIKYVY